MNQIKTFILLAVLSTLLIGVSYSLIGGTGGILIGLTLAAVTNLGSWYFSDQIALAAYRAQPVSASQAPGLYRTVQQLCDRANLPMPKLYVVPSPAANAFATGRDPNHAAVAVTEGIVNLLPADELAGVIAHELSHIRHRDTLTQAIAATLAGAIAFLAQMFSYSLWFGGGRDRDGANPIGLIATLILAPLAASLIQLGISRTREFAADAGAAELTGNPRALAQALQRLDQNARQLPLAVNPAFSPLLIVNSLSGSVLNSLFSTHPSTESRIQKLLQLEQEMSRKDNSRLSFGL